MLILAVGGLSQNWQLSIHFHQSEQLSGVVFVFCLPYILGHMLDLRGIWRKINNTLSLIGLTYAVVCITAIFIRPDLFISSVVHKSTWLTYQADYGRGMEGPLYFIRDGLLTIYSFYGFFIIARTIRKQKNTSYLIYPLVGMFIAIMGGAVDTGFVYLGVNYDFFPHEYFSRFSLGITIFGLSVIAGLVEHYVNVAKEVENAHRLISISEKKYRVLVEGTNDLIFTLDGDCRFISANRAAQKELHYNMDELASKKFTEILYIGEASNDVELQVIRDKLDEFNRTKAPLSMNASLVGDGSEPKEYQLRFEFVNTEEGEGEIIVKASALPTNKLMRYLESESQKYVIGNLLVTAEDISKRLVANLHKYMDQHEITTLRIGLREIIINAIEHGNLNISFEDKTDATMNLNYIDYITERQRDPRFRDKKVTIKFSLSPDRVIYVIEDEGNGFDYQKILSRVNAEVNAQELAHGRGITMALGVFDKIRYNDTGNKVTLVKMLKDAMEEDEALA
jgi:anti-sigma regulatory factor (Ser/Thr protein kinase)/PAS domain-containing protein